MKVSFEKIKELLRRLWEILLESPVELLLGLTYFILIEGAWDWVGNEIGAWFIPNFLLVSVLHRVSGSRTKWKAAYWLSWLTWIPLNFFPQTKSLTAILAVAYCMMTVAYFWTSYKAGNKDYAGNALSAILGIAFGLVLTGVLSLMVALLFLAVDFLFPSFDIDYLEDVLLFAVIVIGPTLCVALKQYSEGGASLSKVINILVNFILSPSVLVYTAVLYIYILKIVFRWELPDGGVSNLVSIYVAIALVCDLGSYLVEKNYFAWMYRWFSVMASAPVLLMWIGVFRRISEYGFTSSRVYLLVSVILITLFLVMRMLPKTNRYQLMTVVAVSALAFFTYIPGISARSISNRSQMARLDRLMPEIQEAGVDPECIDYEMLARDSILASKVREASSAREYLRSSMDSAAFAAVTAEYGDLVFVKYKLAAAVDKLEKISSSESSVIDMILVSDVDLGEYTELVNTERYSTKRYYDRDTAIVIYESETNKPLIVCDLSGKVLSEDGEFIIGKTVPLSDIGYYVFSNGQYCAVVSQYTITLNKEEKTYSVNAPLKNITLLRKPKKNK